MHVFPQQTMIYRCVTRQKAEKAILFSAGIGIPEIKDMIGNADRRGIEYISDWRACVSIIPFLKNKGGRKVTRYRVSITTWECKVPFL